MREPAPQSADGLLEAVGHARRQRDTHSASVWGGITGPAVRSRHTFSIDYTHDTIHNTTRFLSSLGVSNEIERMGRGGGGGACL